MNEVCNDVTVLLTDAANISLKRCVQKTKRKVKRHVQWYNNSLYSLKRSVLNLGKLLRRFPNDAHIRGKLKRIQARMP